MMVIAGGDERGAGAVAHYQLEAEDAAIEGERAVDLCDAQDDVVEAARSTLVIGAT